MSSSAVVFTNIRSYFHKWPAFAEEMAALVEYLPFHSRFGLILGHPGNRSY